MHLQKKFYEVGRLVLKIFLSADFENIHEYTFEKKNSLKPFSCFKHFMGVYYEDNLEYTCEKKIFEVVHLVSKIFLGANSKKSHEYTFVKRNSLKPFGSFKNKKEKEKEKSSEIVRLI